MLHISARAVPSTHRSRYIPALILTVFLVAAVSTVVGEVTHAVLGNSRPPRAAELLRPTASDGHLTEGQQQPRQRRHLPRWLSVLRHANTVPPLRRKSALLSGREGEAAVQVELPRICVMHYHVIGRVIKWLFTTVDATGVTLPADVFMAAALLRPSSCTSRLEARGRRAAGSIFTVYNTSQAALNLQIGTDTKDNVFNSFTQEVHLTVAPGEKPGC